MTTNQKLEALLDKADRWPDDDKQDLIAYARGIEARQSDVYTLNHAERTAVEEGIAEADAQEFASNQELNKSGVRNVI